MIAFTTEELAVAMGLSILLGASLAIIGSGAYANWRLQRILSGLDANGTILQQLTHERALYVNELVDLVSEMKRVHDSTGGMLRKMEELKGSIDAAVNDTTPLAPLRTLKLKANDTSSNPCCTESP